VKIDSADDRSQHICALSAAKSDREKAVRYLPIPEAGSVPEEMDQMIEYPKCDLDHNPP